MPDVTVEVAFVTAPGAETPTWTDISADWMSIEIQRGRNQELDRYQTGTATVVLKDTARKYDPANVASPYSPNVVPMKRVRIRATWNAVTYDLFHGFVEEYVHQYAGPPNGMATATLRCVDGFAVLAAADLPSSAYAAEVLNDAPVGWWRLGEPDTTTVAVDSAGSADLTRTGAGVTMGQTSLVARDTDTAAQFIDDGLGEEDGFQRYGDALVTTAPLTFELLYQWVGPSVDGLLGGQVSGFAAPGTGAAGFAMGISGTTVSAAFGNGTADGTLSAVVPAINDGLPHHLVAVWEAGGTLRLYVDAVQVDTDGPLTPAAFPAQAWFNIGGAAWLGDEVVDSVIDEVALYDTALSAARIAAHYEALVTPWRGDTPEERLDRILDLVAWPTALRDLDPGTSTLQSAELDVSALEHAQRVAASDFGALFIDVSGNVRFIGRDGLWNRPQVAAFGDDPADPAELGYRSIEPEFTAALIRNDITVSRIEGVAQRVEDAASIGAYLRRSFTMDGLIHDSDDLSRSAANFLLTEYKDPRRRVTSMVVAPRGDPNRVGSRPEDLFPAVLGVDLADQIQVEDRPPGGGAVNVQDSAVEGIAHAISPMWWETEWRLAPAFGSAGLGQVGIWDETDWSESRWAI